jgi:hypothetical protein
MTPMSIVRGAAAPILKSNINTDIIIPGAYLRSQSADLAHGFGGTSENFGSGIFFHGCSECCESAFGEPVIGLEKYEPLASGEEGAAIHGIVEPSVASTVDGEVRKRVRDLERSVGRAAVHDEMLKLDPLPHRAADGVFESRRGVERGSDDGEERGGGQCHEI